MGTFVSKECKAWVGRYALHGRLNAITIDDATDALDETSFGDTTRKNKPGLAVVTAAYAGLFESDGTSAIDDAIQSVRGASGVVVSMAPETGAVGKRCFTFRAMQSQITREGTIGDLYKISAAAVASDGEGLIPGCILHNATVTTTGDGTAVNLGAVADGEYLYAALHVLAKDGTSPTLDVVLESDVDADFDGSETTRITFAEQTGEAAVWATRVAGPITDTWWRASHAIGGTDSPEFEYVLIVGII